MVLADRRRDVEHRVAASRTFSVRRRAMYSRRLKVASSMSAPAIDEHLLDARQRLRAPRRRRPIGSMGTTRKPATLSLLALDLAPSSTRRASRRLALRRGSGTRGRRRTAAPSAIPPPAATARRKRVGVLISRPQPSPVLPSAAIAPRWVRRFRELMAVCTTQWLGLSSRLAIRPKPQESRS